MSDPERSRGLHAAGRALLDEIEADHRVRRRSFTEEEGPGVLLSPKADGAASFGLNFTAAPGVRLWWDGQRRGHLPARADDETLQGCVDELRGWADMVVGGTFGQSVSIADGRWWHRVWGATSHGRFDDTRLPVGDAEAERLLALMPDGEQTWRHWPRHDQYAAPRTPHGPGPGRVRVWFDDLGWGVIDGPGVPGGCWTHYSQIVMTGFRTLAPGRPVELEWEAPGQDDWPYRAVRVTPA